MSVVLVDLGLIYRAKSRHNLKTHAKEGFGAGKFYIAIWRHFHSTFKCFICICITRIKAFACTFKKKKYY